MQTPSKNRIHAAIAGLLGLAAFVLPATAETVYFDNFNDQQNISSGGPYTQTLAGSVPTTRIGTLGGNSSAVWGSGAEVGGWGQRSYGNNNVATPTSSNFLPFTPDSSLIYTVQMTIDTTPLGGAGAGGWGESWMTVGFTSSQHNWNGTDGGTIDTADLVRFKSNTTTTITYTRTGADLLAAGINYVGWVTDWPGLVNMNAVTQVKIDNFSLTAGVPNPTVTYNGNGNDGGTAPTDSSSPYTHSATVTALGAGSLTRTGFNFIGWNTAADGTGTDYTAGATFTIYDHTTLYAKWLPVTYAILTYNGNGSTSGSAPVDSSSPYTSGTTATVLGVGTLTKDSYSFNGWNTAADGSGTTYNPADTFTINTNTTLYARWTPGPDYVWNNQATTDNWNTSDANWSGTVWSHSSTNNAIFTTVGGTIFLDPGIVAGEVNVGKKTSNIPNLGFYDGDLSATTLTIQGSSTNYGIYATNPTLTLDSTITITGDARVGRANLNISGGTFTANRIITAPDSADWGRLVVSGIAVATATNGVDGSIYTGATFAIDLNGGELKTPSIKVADREAGTNNNSWLTFNGGKLTAIGADNANFITTYGGNSNTYIASGGAIIDTNGFNIGIQTNLIDSNGGGGGLTKQGAGTLTISGSYNYTGATIVEGGTLSLTTATLSDTAPVDVGTSAVINLPTGTTDTVSDFLINGVSQGPGTWNAANTGGRITGGNLLVIPPDPYLAWIEQSWPALADKSPAGDPDSDGIPNLVEYVLQGGDPSQSTTGILPTVDATGANFIFTFNRRTAATGTTQNFEYSTDLSGWTPLAIPGGSGVTVTDLGNGIEQVQITVTKGSNTRLFGHLQVTQP